MKKLQLFSILACIIIVLTQVNLAQAQSNEILSRFYFGKWSWEKSNNQVLVTVQFGTGESRTGTRTFPTELSPEEVGTKIITEYCTPNMRCTPIYKEKVKNAAGKKVLRSNVGWDIFIRQDLQPLMISIIQTEIFRIGAELTQAITDSK